MADTDIGWAHAEGIAALLDPLPYPVYIGEITAEDDELEYPYVVLWPPPADRLTITMAGYGGEGTTTTQITAAGRSTREVISALDRVGAALHRRRPTIPGRVCGLITQPLGAGNIPDPQRDEQVSTPERPIFYSFVRVTFNSSAAPQEP
ncbi:hypothetical protein AB0B94_30690 [Micromonospora sp. NPDC048986]|uniref:hypothetical protein n=1 Tax=Micromonospora sp. NPDC048986 TaxID=3155644 RepID=UPI0033C2A0BE